MIADLKSAISGTDNRALFKEIYDRFFAGKQPARSVIDNSDFNFSGDVPASLSNYRNEVFLQWPNDGYLAIKRDEIVLFGLNSFTVEPASMLSILEQLPFEIASFGALYPDWLNPVNPYEAPSFSRFHLPHGWACAFKGKGHDRLVSRRWLDFGPWILHTGKNDTQLIQFHRLDADAHTALEQAEPGHIAMGITDDGGFIQDEYVYKYDNQGLYDRAEKKLKVIVHGSSIPNRQLLDACAARLYQPLGSNMPLSNIAYVFMEEEPAQKHLHQIWLRGLECRVIRAGREEIISDQYDPKPEKPLWVIEQ